MKYKTIETAFSRKFWDALKEKSRYIVPWYSEICPKEVFVNRTLNEWFGGKYIAFIKHKEWDVEGHIKFPVKVYACINRIVYTLGYGENVTLYYSDASDIISSGLNCIEVNSYNMERIQFIDSSKAEYLDVAKLFFDDRDEEEFTFTGYDKATLTTQEVNLVGKTRFEASEAYKGDLILR